MYTQIFLVSCECGTHQIPVKLFAGIGRWEQYNVFMDEPASAGNSFQLVPMDDFTWDRSQYSDAQNAIIASEVAEAREVLLLDFVQHETARLAHYN